MTAYEDLKRKEMILREACLRAESQDMKKMWLVKSLALRCMVNNMTVEEAERIYAKLEDIILISFD